MYISEIFYSIQGEGPDIGRPSVFLRLAGCNLKCGFCDSKFSLKINKNKTPINQILKKIKSFPVKNLVITGGEPLLQQEKLKKLLPKLKNYHIEVETNGTIKPEISKFITRYNCSPKLSGSGNKNCGLKKFPATKTAYKFVIGKQTDLKEVKKIIKAHKIRKEKVWLMPEAITEKELKKKSKWLIGICKKENFNYSTRLHIILFGNKRGI